MKYANQIFHIYILIHIISDLFLAEKHTYVPKNWLFPVKAKGEFTDEYSMQSVDELVL